MTKKTLLLIGGSVLAVFLLITTLLLFKIVTVNGDEYAIKESWNQGVLPEIYPPKTYFLFPGFSQNMYRYKASQQVYVMNDDPDDANDGRDKDSYLVQSKEGQDMRLSLAVQWRRDPDFGVYLHQSTGHLPNAVEEKVLRPELMRVVKDEATQMEALKAYSGDGLVQLQNNILNKLRDPNGELKKRGIIVDNFVIQHCALDPKYVEQIKEKQVAVQQRLKNIEQTAAALAAAERTKAEAQADYNRAVVESERDKKRGILEAEKEAQQKVLAAEASKQQTILAAQAAQQQVTLAAEAEKRRVVLAGEGEAEAGKLRGQGIEAVGSAESNVIKMKMFAYSSTGAENFVRMEVAKSLSEAFKGIKGYLPSNMSVNMLTDNFDKSVSVLLNGQPTVLETSNKH